MCLDFSIFITSIFIGSSKKVELIEMKVGEERCELPVTESHILKLAVPQIKLVSWY